MIKFHTIIEQYTNNINVQSGFNSAIFINSGSCNLTLNGATIIPGASIAIDGNVNEIDTTTQYIVSFTIGGTTPQITVIKKIYNEIR
jgi:hypothetical protein